MTMLMDMFKNLKTLLHENILDPRTGSKSSTRSWIYPDYPRVDATFPRISIIQTGVDSRELSLGDKGRIFTVTFDIDTWNKMGESFTFIDPDLGQITAGGNELREYLGDQIVKTLISKRGEFCSSHGYLDLLILNVSNAPLDPETRLFRKTITIQILALETY